MFEKHSFIIHAAGYSKDYAVISWITQNFGEMNFYFIYKYNNA